MAELLVKAVNATHPDPDKDRRGCYKRGDPVAVTLDGWLWGRRESRAVWNAESWTMPSTDWDYLQVQAQAWRDLIVLRHGLDPEDPNYEADRRRLEEEIAALRAAVTARVGSPNDGLLLRDPLDVISSTSGGVTTVTNVPGRFPAKTVVLKVPGLSVEAARDYIRSWTRALAFVVESSTLSTDTHTMTVSVDSGVSVGGEGVLTRQQVETYLNDWNASVVAIATNSVTFTTAIFAAIRSAGFWNRDVSAVSFTEVSYTQSTGNHRVRADYPAGITAAGVEDAIRARGGTVISHNTGLRRVTFDITRALVRQHFEASVRDRLGELWSRRRFRLAETEVASIETAGGTVTRTVEQVQAAMRDRQAE